MKHLVLIALLAMSAPAVHAVPVHATKPLAIPRPEPNCSPDDDACTVRNGCSGRPCAA